MFKNNRNLAIIALVAIVNALGYGIIIPILYSYSQKFGLSDFQNGLLFALFSVCQFISTPIIGRLSDKYGRKPLLAISLAGTAISFFTMAFAPSAIFLFLARALDGLTAGNLPVAQAVISDTTDAKDRAKGFGLIGAAFGFGFIFGPAISALTVGYGTHVPFIIAGMVTLVAVFMTTFVLPETNKQMGKVKKGKLFDFKKLVNSIFEPAIGKTLAISLIYSTAFSLFIYGYQPFTVKILKLTPTEIAGVFTAIGVIGLIAQVALIPKVVAAVGDKKALLGALTVTILTFLGMGLTVSLPLFMLFIVINAFANSFVMPMLSTLLSKEVDALSQGSVQGLNASYMSVGQIIGPVIGGIVATYSLSAPFLLASLLSVMCVYFGYLIVKTHIHKEALF
jgi:MFS family permease